MQPVKAGEHEKRRAVNARRQLQILLGVRVNVLVRLEAEKREPEYDRDEQPEVQCAPVAGLQRMMRDGQRTARSQQDDRVEERNPHRAHRRELLLEIRAHRRPLRRVVGPQHAAGERAAEIGNGDVPDEKQRAEERREEHHLAEDEPAHPPAKRGVDFLVVELLLRFADHRAEPAEQHDEQHQKACADEPWPVADAVDPAGRAEREQEQRARARDGPVRRMRHVVMRLGARCRCAHVIPWLSLNVPGRPQSASGHQLPLPSTSKNVYDSEIVVSSRGAEGSTTNTTGIFRDSPGCSVCLVKQKQSSLRKYCAAYWGP